MTTIQVLATRLSSLSDQNKQTVQLIHRLAKLQLQPGSTPLEGGDEGDVRVELSSEIHDSLKQQEEELELFRQEVEELIGSRGPRSGTKGSEKERQKSRLSIQVARLEEDLKQARSQFRKAQLQAKRNAEAAKQKERELLFAGIQEGSALPSSASRRNAANSKLTQDEIVAAASSDVTAALRRTHHLMTSELSRSRFAQETLDASTAALADLGERYTDLNSLLSNSKTLVNSLLRSQKTDTWYLETTLYILLTTLAWLAYRRFLWGPTWWFVWLPLKLTYKLVFGVLAALGLSGSSSSSTSPQLNVSAPAFSGTGSSSSRSLIVKPSASNRPPPRQPGQQAHFVRAGAGGVGVKQGEPQQQAPYQPHQQQQQQEEEEEEAASHRDPSPDGSMSQQVGRMAEAAAKGQQGQQGQQGDDVPRRGDGQPLQQSDRPRNPKKRVMDVGEEQERMRGEAEEQKQQDEAAQGQQQQAERRRDEFPGWHLENDEGSPVRYSQTWVDGAVFTIGKRGDKPILEPNEVICDTKDEISWVTVGSDAHKARSTYVAKGDTTTAQRDQDHTVSYPGAKPAFHTYSVDGTPHRINWEVNRQIMRTVLFDDAVKDGEFPQTPAKVRVGMWAIGDPEHQTRSAVELASCQTSDTKEAGMPWNMYNASALYNFTGRSRSADQVATPPHLNETHVYHYNEHVKPPKKNDTKPTGTSKEDQVVESHRIHLGHSEAQEIREGNVVPPGYAPKSAATMLSSLSLESQVFGLFAFSCMMWAL